MYNKDNLLVEESIHVRFIDKEHDDKKLDLVENFISGRINSCKIQ